tara:strand:- start:617 stop:1183 length:567 start_codon:yes stop_codon:yes gene_type:complete
MALSKIDVANMLTGATPVANGGTALTSGFVNGITVAEQWHLTSNKTSAGDITANLSLFSSNGAGNINAGMSQSSGIFTFPSTGFWQITFRMQIEEGNQSSNDGIIRPEIHLTTDNSSYEAVARGQEGIAGGTVAEFGASSSASLIFDVTNTTTHKCKFSIQSLSSNDRLLGASSQMFTSFIFMRLGDT